MHCLYITKDLFFSSRVCSLARDRNVDVKVVPSVEAAAEEITDEVKLAIIDLSQAGTEIVESVTKLRQNRPKMQIIAYGPHVDEETLAAARQAGCDDVMPRSRFDQEIISILEIALNDT